MPAHAAHAWVTTHLKKPFMVPIGLVSRRGKLGSNVISDRLELRSSVFLCAPCEAKMPRAWARRYEYRLVPDLHTPDTRCDACQKMRPANIYTPEDGGYYQDYQKLQRISDNAAKAQVAINDRRRFHRD